MLDRLWKLLCQRRSVQLFVVIACLAWPATCVWHRLTRPGEAQLLRQARRLASRGERSFREEGRARDAEAAWLKAVELSSDAWPDPHEALLKLYAVQLRAPEIRRELEAIGRFREWKLTELYQLVNATGEAVNRGDAIPRLERFTLADPGDVHSLVALGRYYLWDERQDDAEATFRRALAQSPGDTSIRAYLAEALMKRGDTASAGHLLRETAIGRKSPPCLWRSLGLYFAATEDWPSAAACLARAVEMHPWERSTVYQLALALEKVGNSDDSKIMWQRVEWLVQLKAALFRFVQAPANRSEVATASLMQAGETLLLLGRFEEARAFFDQVLAVNFAWPQARERRDEALRLQRPKPGEPGDGGADTTLESALAAASGLLESTTPDADSSRQLGAPPIRFVDRHREAHIEFQYDNGARGLKYLLETTGGGVGVLDFDADGWPDLFFPQGGAIPIDGADGRSADGLFWNRGDGTFTEVSRMTGLVDDQYSQGCAVADYDNDGFTDLAVANCGTNVLYRNNGDGTFTDFTRTSGIAGNHWSTSLGWGDIDLDGDLDLYVVNYVVDHLQPCRDRAGEIHLCHPQTFEAEPDAMYVNHGDGTFEDILVDAGMAARHGRGLGLVIADLDDDGWPEIYVANDANPSFLFRNRGRTAEGGPRFVESGFPSGTAVNAAGNATAAMGVACADMDGDGRLDLYVSNFYQEADILYLNRGNLIFEDASRQAGIAEATRPVLGWGAQALDADLDGWPEIFVTNGHLDDLRDRGLPWKMPPQLFYNLQNGRFRGVSLESGEFFSREYLGRGVARADFNRDGLPDLVVVHHDRPVALLVNETPQAGHRLVVELHGVTCNRDAIGARLRVTAGGQAQILEICGGDGYAATNERRQVIGVGSANRIDELQVTWPGGHVQSWRDLPVDVALTVIEGRSPVVVPFGAFRR